MSSDTPETVSLATSKSKAKSKRIDSDSQSNASATLELPHTKTEDDHKSESEMSVLIDATPIKRGAKKKEKAPAKIKKNAKEKKAKKSTVKLSKDEETIKRLKSFVHACGVRKIWTKEFQNLDSPSQQIKWLKEILAELGMNGRLSMEKAKAIKEKRDLAKELEDVQSFEQAVIGQPSRNQSGAKKHTARRETDSADESESDFTDDAPAKHKNAARRSIMAFLGDGDDDE